MNNLARHLRLPLASPSAANVFNIAVGLVAFLDRPSQA